MGYFNQEGLFDETAYGLVDLGWTGQSKSALEKLLRMGGHPPAPFFFFGRRNNSAKDERSVTHSFLFDDSLAVGNNHGMNNIEGLLEMFCASEQEGLAGYREKDNQFAPVFRASTSKALNEWGYKLMRQAILCYAERLTEIAPLFSDYPPMLTIACGRLLETFWLNPTHEEALVWGAFPYEEDILGHSSACLAPELDFPYYCRLLKKERQFVPYTVWRQGVFRRSSRFWIHAIQFTIWFRSLLGRCKRKILKLVRKAVPIKA
jgi:hypothetical protein